MNELAKLIALGIATPDTIIELSNGRGDANDDERNGIVREDITEHERASRREAE